MIKSFTLASIAVLLTTSSAIAQLSCEQNVDSTCTSTGHYIEDLDGRIDPTTHSVTLAHPPAAEEPIRLFEQGREELTVPFTIKLNVLQLARALPANERVSIEYYSTPPGKSQKAEVADLQRKVIGNAIDAESDLLLRPSRFEVDTQSIPRQTLPAAQPLRGGTVRESHALSLLEDDISAQARRRQVGHERPRRNRSLTVQGVDGLADENPSIAVFRILNPNRRRSAVDALEDGADQRSLRSGSRALDMLVKQVEQQQNKEEPHR